MHHNHKLLLIFLSSLKNDKSYRTRDLRNMISNDEDILRDYHRSATFSGYVKRWRKAFLNCHDPSYHQTIQVPRYYWDLDDFDRVSRGLHALVSKGFLTNESQTRIGQFKLTKKGLNTVNNLLGNKALALTDHRNYIRRAANNLLKD